jgi:hypothetical protein
MLAFGLSVNASGRSLIRPDWQKPATTYRILRGSARIFGGRGGIPIIVSRPDRRLSLPLDCTAAVVIPHIDIARLC